jgi:hypothetical protein
LLIPIRIDVFLLGFKGDGGFGVAIDANRLYSLLGTHLSVVCPTDWEAGEDLGICFQPSFQIIGAEEEPQVMTVRVAYIITLP